MRSPECARTTIDTLPNEILQEIFSIAYDHQLSSALNKTYPPVEVRLSHVCQRWRGIATAIPKLWSSVVLDIADRRFRRARVDIYAKRSASHPLVIDCYLRGQDDKSDDIVFPSAYDELLQKFVDLSYRCRTLHLSCDVASRAADGFLDGLRHVSVPLLETFDILTTSNFVAYQQRRIFFGGSPALRYIKLFGPPLTFLRPASLRALTHLDIIDTTSAPFLLEQFDLMQELRFLQHLRIRRGVMHSLLAPLHAIPVSDLPHLLSLDLASAFLPLSSLLYLISAPSLRTLTLFGIKDKDLNEPEDLICPKYPSLKEIRLIHPIKDKCTPALLRRLALYFPNITRMSTTQLQVLDYLQPFLYGLTIGRTWTKLETLAVAPLLTEPAIRQLHDVLRRKRDAGHPVSTLLTIDNGQNLALLNEVVQVLTVPDQWSLFDPPSFFP